MWLQLCEIACWINNAMLMPTKMVEMEWIRSIVILFRSSWMKNIGMKIKMDKGEKIRKLWKPSQIELFCHGTFSGLGRGVQKWILYDQKYSHLKESPHFVAWRWFKTPVLSWLVCPRLPQLHNYWPVVPGATKTHEICPFRGFSSPRRHAMVGLTKKRDTCENRRERHFVHIVLLLQQLERSWDPKIQICFSTVSTVSCQGPQPPELCDG